MREGRLEGVIHQFLELQSWDLQLFFFFLFNGQFTVRSSEVKFYIPTKVIASNDYGIDFKGSTKQYVIAAELGEGDTLWKEVA